MRGDADNEVVHVEEAGVQGEDALPAEENLGEALLAEFLKQAGLQGKGAGHWDRPGRAG